MIVAVATLGVGAAASLEVAGEEVGEGLSDEAAVSPLYLWKLFGLLASPFARTLFLDADVFRIQLSAQKAICDRFD